MLLNTQLRFLSFRLFADVSNLSTCINLWGLEVWSQPVPDAGGMMLEHGKKKKKHQSFSCLLLCRFVQLLSLQKEHKCYISHLVFSLVLLYIFNYLTQWIISLDSQQRVWSERQSGMKHNIPGVPFSIAKINICQARSCVTDSIVLGKEPAVPPQYN